MPDLKYKSRSLSTRAYKLRGMTKNPVVQVSTALLLTIFTIIFFAAFAIRPTLATITELIKKIDDQRVVADKLDKKSTALATAQSEFLLVEDRLGLVEAAVPSDHLVDLLLKQIEGLAASVRIPIESIQVERIAFPSGALEEMTDGVYEIPLAVNITSHYSDLREFLKLTTSMQRLLNAESLSFTIDPNDSNLIRMNIQMRAYYLPQEEL